MLKVKVHIIRSIDFHYSGATELEIKVALSHLNATAGEVKVTCNMQTDSEQFSITQR